MDKVWHYDVQRSGWERESIVMWKPNGGSKEGALRYANKGGWITECIMMCKLKRWMDKGGHNEVDMKK